jgi:sucrose-6-phosphate hydrolase SacC (GH32 family)
MGENVIMRHRTFPSAVGNPIIGTTVFCWLAATAQHLALATSPDLRNWTLGGPIEISRQGWNRRKYGAPFIWREGSQWVMILMGTNEQDRTTFGLLTSTDGMHWQPLPESGS